MVGREESSADSGIYYRGEPCICEGSGDHLGPLRVQGNAQWGGGGKGEGLSPPEAPGN